MPTPLGLALLALASAVGPSQASSFTGEASGLSGWFLRKGLPGSGSYEGGTCGTPAGKAASAIEGTCSWRAKLQKSGAPCTLPERGPLPTGSWGLQGQNADPELSGTGRA